jgi:hypothetical protein
MSASRPLFPAVSDDLPDEALSLDQLGARIVGMAGRLAAATCRWLLLVAAFDAQQGAHRFCLQSTAHWLGHYCGLSRRTAIEHVRVARALAAHSPLREAMAAGRISFSHVRAITRVAELGDERLVTNLVMVAEHGTVGQLEDVVRGLRTVDDNNTADRPTRGEAVSHRWRADSYLGYSARLEPEHGALLIAAVEKVARAEGITHAQALTRIAELASAAVDSGEQPAPSLRGDEYAAIVVHLDAAKVPADAADPDDPAEPADPERADARRPAPAKSQAEVEKCSAERTSAADPSAAAGRRTYREPYARIARGPGLPDATVKRLLCSGRIRAIVTTEHPYDRTAPRRYRWRKGVLDVGASKRLVSDKQFRALLVRDGGACSVPGCTSRIGIEAHHVRHWLYGGKTVLANLVLLCRRHHHALHEGEFRIVAEGRERFRFLTPDGRALPRHVDPSTQATPGDIAARHSDVDPWAATTRWDGQRLDRHYAVAALAQHLHSTNAPAA